MPNNKPLIPDLLFAEHHQSHAAAAFYPSPFDDAVILCMDGVGEWSTTSVWIGNSNNIKTIMGNKFSSFIRSSYTLHLLIIAASKLIQVNIN